jgi:uncharacterized lipoprotein YmbA
MMRVIRKIAVIGATIALAACSVAPVPEIAYYRMPEVMGVTPRERAAFQMPVVVETFLADGLHGEQSILYAGSPTGSVRAYHYQLWNDPPVRLLQRRLIRRLREEMLSPVVADRLPTSVAAVRVSGLIDRFERVKHDDGWYAEVRLELRADIQDGGLPAILKVYESSMRAESDSIQATVRAFTAATDQVLAAFAADLALIEP